MGRKIPYYKNIEKDSKKQMGRGGPRDIQRKQDFFHQEIELLRKLLEEKRPEKKTASKDESQSLPFEEVKRKIQEAVEFTKEEEIKKYEGSLKDLNDQLDAAKKKMAILEKQLVGENAEVKRLELRVVGLSQNGKSQTEINNLEKQLKEKKVELEKKDGIIAGISENYSKNINELKHKLDNIAEKIIHGTTFLEDPERPQINDKVFIDPLEEEAELDSHITIDAEKSSAEKVNRNVISDIKRLKDLLKAKKRDN